MIFDLSHQTAVVTGSTKGIGRAIAEELARAGANIVISSRNPEACKEVAAAIVKEGYEAIAIPCDIARREDCEALIAKSLEKYGQIDTLVCNAAINPHLGSMTGLSSSDFHQGMETNVESNLWLANLVHPGMAARRDGTIIFVSSIGGMKGTTTLGMYALTKAAQMQLARNLAVEWGPENIRVNCLAPGLVMTDFAREWWEDPALRKGSESRTALRRLGEPQDIAGAAVFLASRAGRWITGQSIVIDGGRSVS
jgi:NAD(P)-dependent dehydrogenase (short-subunit alcohol dehydrogenase family)